MLGWFSNRTGTSDGWRLECARNSLDFVLIWPYLRIYSAHAVVKRSVLLLNRLNYLTVRARKTCTFQASYFVPILNLWNNVCSIAYFFYLFIYNTASSNFRSINCQVVAYGRVNTNANFKRLALKLVAGAHARCFLQEVLNAVLWLGAFFGKLVAKERWSLTRRSCNQRFHCMCAKTLGKDHEIYH